MNTLTLAEAKREYPNFASWAKKNRFWDERPSSVVYVGSDGSLFLGYSSPGLTSRIEHVVAVWDEQISFMTEEDSFDTLREATAAARRLAEAA